ncbi:MAG: UvrD-helicase domain-containing protein [Anaerolineales bacterium]
MSATPRYLQELTEAQQEAVEASGQDVLVSAGAGSGKTRTLVARYLAALAEGFEPRQVAAITFTEKAAREMRNRIRRAAQLEAEVRQSETSAARWRRLANAMDGARIGTIHSLCAEILRNHPAEAGLDPEFEVLEEGMARVLQYESVESALAAAANDPQAVSIYQHYGAWALRKLLLGLLEKRLEVDPALLTDFLQSLDLDHWLTKLIQDFLEEPSVAESIRDLRTLKAEGYFQSDATDAMRALAEGLLAGLEQLESSLEEGAGLVAASQLFDMRRQHMRGGVGKRDGRARMAIDQLQDRYDESIDPWLGGKRSTDDPPDPGLEQVYPEMRSAVQWAYQRARQEYIEALDKRAALDFDALEAGALQLLAIPSIRVRWQDAMRRVLVDEYQDTNQRQQAIIQALAQDESGKLFVVGDARQSIYRFRGAEVEIFQSLKGELEKEGHALLLDRTFRQHPKLLEIFDDWLPPILDEAQTTGDYRISYQPLRSDRESHLASTQPPYVEFLIGLGDRADKARPIAAGLLAERLLQMRRAGELGAWDQAALLFRASTGFSSYEDALSDAGIPYVTVAGRGFYERPEIREVLNALRALAEPWNNTAMVGLLRSAAVGMTDVGIYRLRVNDGSHRALVEALEISDLELSERDQAARVRALAMLAEFGPMVDRMPVVELLKRWVDWVDGRALLAIAGERQWANLDKLLMDARRSGATRVRSFLEYLRLSQQAGVREGEAPAETSGALRLMTIHKAKGLEFDFVVLADAGYQQRAFRPDFMVHPEMGLALKPDRWSASSLRFRVARALEQSQEQAEEARLLYVALTRAREKLLISGHGRLGARGVLVYGWLEEVLATAGVETESLQSGAAEHGHFRLIVSDEVPEFEPYRPEPSQVEVEEAHPIPLFPSLEPKQAETTDEGYDEPLARGWRASGRRRPPAAVVGVLVHRAIERWRFPPDEALDELLRVSAIGEGLVDEAPRRAALSIAKELLSRFQSHSLHGEVAASVQRYHEVPYTYSRGLGAPDSGTIDLLYRGDNGWHLLDFKTDELHGPEDLEEAMKRHDRQIRRYWHAAQRLLKEPVEARVVFLDYDGEVRVAPLPQVPPA